ncbi:hypothetical protein [Bifidobacterium cebidarum]|uniref:Uncharacterized protein n=1 Tax=Bifidobacterium cebidarum TaxID=2650773 RepID=A0A6I1GP37_9BIFI|nr:hypothetical protein [Bifidobacterium cebidarum]KAB7788321.1 hypothetical protein F7D08_1062 [Bifidobacterium cebidarum]
MLADAPIIVLYKPFNGLDIAGAIIPMSEPVAIIAALLSVRVLTDTATAMPLFLIEPKRTRLFLTLCADIVAAGSPASIVGGLAATGSSRLILCLRRFLSCDCLTGCCMAGCSRIE